MRKQRQTNSPTLVTFGRPPFLVKGESGLTPWAGILPSKSLAAASASGFPSSRRPTPKGSIPTNAGGIVILPAGSPARNGYAGLASRTDSASIKVRETISSAASSRHQASQAAWAFSSGRPTHSRNFSLSSNSVSGFSMCPRAGGKKRVSSRPSLSFTHTPAASHERSANTPCGPVSHRGGIHLVPAAS